jgi:hypothetical protein
MPIGELTKAVNAMDKSKVDSNYKAALPKDATAEIKHAAMNKFMSDM